MVGGENVIVKKGSFTLQSRTNAGSVIINHNLGVIPQIFIINAPDYDTEIGANKDSDTLYGMYCSVNSSNEPNGSAMVTAYYALSTSTSISNASISATSIGRTTFEASLTSTSCCGIAYNNNYKYALGVTYNWIAIAGIE